jgi:hypothetical protein
VGGLLRYLFGPGKREEHVRPRVMAAWDGAGPLSGLQPGQFPSVDSVRRWTRRVAGMRNSRLIKSLLRRTGV